MLNYGKLLYPYMLLLHCFVLGSGAGYRYVVLLCCIFVGSGTCYGCEREGKEGR